MCSKCIVEAVAAHGDIGRRALKMGLHSVPEVLKAAGQEDAAEDVRESVASVFALGFLAGALATGLDPVFHAQAKAQGLLLRELQEAAAKNPAPREVVAATLQRVRHGPPRDLPRNGRRQRRG